MSQGDVTIDPAKFACDKWSPVSTPYWSSGRYPSVALTHIFCGQIKSSDESEGFHSRPNGKDPTCARAVTYDSHIAGLDCYKGEDVYDAKNYEWVSRKPQDRFCFFPEKWSIEDTVGKIQDVFDDCTNSISNNMICGRNYNGEGFDIIIFLSSIGGGQYKVVSSFATPNNKVYCKVNCTLGKKGVNELPRTE